MMVPVPLFITMKDHLINKFKYTFKLEARSIFNIFVLYKIIKMYGLFYR